MGRFFIMGSLPTLDFGSKPDISVSEFLELLRANLTGGDEADFVEFERWIDLNNMNRLFWGKKLNPNGLLSEEAIQDFITQGVGFPDYVYEFLSLYTTDAGRKEHFPWLIARYFEEAKKNVSVKLQPLLQFEHELMVVLTAYRAKRLGRDIGRELQFEDAKDPIVASAIAQKDTQGKFSFPYEYMELEQLLNDAGEDPMKQCEMMARYRFDYYLNFVDSEQFSIVGIIAYMMRLWILEEHFNLREDQGNKVLDNLMERKNA